MKTRSRWPPLVLGFVLMCVLCSATSLVLIRLLNLSDPSVPAPSNLKGVPRLEMDVHQIPEMEHRVLQGDMVFGVRSTSSATNVEFLAYDLVAETVSWSIKVPIEDSRGIIAGEGMAFVVGGYDPYVPDEWYIYAISIEDRAIQWEMQTTDIAHPLLGDGNLFYSDDGTLFVREAQTGKELYRFVDLPAITGDSSGPTVYAEGRLYFSFLGYLSEPGVYPVTLVVAEVVTGKVLWRYETPARCVPGYDLECFWPVAVGPGFGEGEVYFGGEAVHALDENTGQVLWQVEDVKAYDHYLAPPRPMYVIGHTLVFCNATHVFAVNLDTCSLAWSRRVPGTDKVFGIDAYVAVGNTIAVYEHETLWIIGMDGQVQALVELPEDEICHWGSHGSGLTVINDRLYVDTNSCIGIVELTE